MDAPHIWNSVKTPRKLQRYGLEFLTVFLGVSLSLLAENWRQRRSDTNAEHNSLAQLNSDLRSEQGDMAINVDRAQKGLRSARLLTAGVRGHSADSISDALTGLGECSFFIPYTSEYTALKSSGRITIIEDPALRERIVRFYEGDPFVVWLHERDCVLTGELMDSLVGKLEFAEPGTTRQDSLRTMRRDSMRAARRDSIGLAGGDTTRFRSTPARGPDSRYPRVVFRAGQESVLEDPALHDRIVRLASQRSYLASYIQNRITEVDALRTAIRSRLGSDTLPRINRSDGAGRRGGRPRNP